MTRLKLTTPSSRQNAPTLLNHGPLLPLLPTSTPPLDPLPLRPLASPEREPQASEAQTSTPQTNLPDHPPLQHQAEAAGTKPFSSGWATPILLVRTISLLLKVASTVDSEVAMNPKRATAAIAIITPATKRAVTPCLRSTSCRVTPSER